VSLTAKRRPQSRRGRAWDEDAIRAELTEFLRGWDAWPTYDEFTAGGAKALRDAVTRIHGAEWWAREMKLSGGDRRRGGVRTWTDDRIRATLTEFLGRRTTWPTQTEFDAAGLQGLREVLRHYGGPGRWSEELGVALSPRQTPASRPRKRPANPPQIAAQSRWPKWNDQTIADALRTFLDGRDEWPRYREFVSSGPPGLYQAVLKHGGTRAWAARLGVTWVKHDGGSVPPWTEDRLRERLAVFLSGRTTWPPSAEFVAAGERRLLRAARRLGGTNYWIKEFGLRAPDRSRRRLSPAPQSAADQHLRLAPARVVSG
jgi:hypothetical protein